MSGKSEQKSAHRERAICVCVCAIIFDRSWERNLTTWVPFSLSTTIYFICPSLSLSLPLCLCVLLCCFFFFFFFSSSFCSFRRLVWFANISTFVCDCFGGVIFVGLLAVERTCNIQHWKWTMQKTQINRINSLARSLAIKIPYSFRIGMFFSSFLLHPHVAMCVDISFSRYFHSTPRKKNWLFCSKFKNNESVLFCFVLFVLT